jgi:ankyrin repeat protein
MINSTNCNEWAEDLEDFISVMSIYKYHNNLGLEIIRIIQNQDITEEKRVSIINNLINQHADVNARDENGCTPLHQAAYNGNLALVRCLVNHGANIHNKTYSGMNALELAFSAPFVENNHVEVAKYLLSIGASITSENYFRLFMDSDVDNANRYSVLNTEFQQLNSELLIGLNADLGNLLFEYINE